MHSILKREYGETSQSLISSFIVVLQIFLKMTFGQKYTVDIISELKNL